MIEVTIDSIRVSLMSQHRVVILKDGETDRYLPIWIGACEADAITIELQGVEVAPPFTHDLLKSSITQLGGKIKSVVISDLRSEVFYAQIVLDVNGREVAQVQRTLASGRNQQLLDVKALPAGMYTVRVTDRSSGTITSLRFVRTR